MDTGIHKSGYYWEDISWSLKIKVKGGNIAIVCIILAYKSKVVNVEDYTLKLYPIINNNNGSPRKDNNCGDNSSTFPPDDGHLWKNVIPEDTYLSSNNIPESRDSILYSLHIYGKIYIRYTK